MKNAILEWTGYADDQEVKGYMEHYNEVADNPDECITFVQAQEKIANDNDYWTTQWEYFMESLGEYMEKREYWADCAKNMGWRNLSGEKVFQATSAIDFIRAISPNTDCSYTFWKYRNGFKVRLSHHDAPMGETHIIKPLTAKQFDKLTQ